MDLLILEHEKHPDNPYMFPSPKTGTMYDPDSFRHTHEKILAAAGIEHIRFHLVVGWLTLSWPLTRFTCFVTEMVMFSTSRSVQRKEKLAQAIEKNGKVDVVRSGKYTVAEWVRLWFETYSKPSIREQTVYYYIIVRRLLPDGRFGVSLEPQPHPLGHRVSTASTGYSVQRWHRR